MSMKNLCTPVLLSLLFFSLVSFSCHDAPPLTLENKYDTESKNYVPRTPRFLTYALLSDSVIAIDFTTLGAAKEQYIIQRRSQHQTEFTTIAMVSKDQLETIALTGTERINRYYDRTPLKMDTVYYYRVAAKTDFAISSFSGAVSIKITLTQPASFSVTGDSSSVTLHWSVNNYFPVYTKIERKDSGGVYSEIARLPSYITTYKDTLLLRKKKYYYRLTTTTAHNQTLPTNEIMIAYTLLSTIKYREITTASSANDMIVSNDESMLAITYGGGGVRVINFSTGATITSFDATVDNFEANTCSFNSSNTLLAVSIRKEVKVYAVPSGTLLRTIQAGSNQFGLAVTSLPNSNIMATINNFVNEQVKLWNIETGDSLFTFPGLMTDALRIYISPDDKRLIVGGDEELNVYDLNTKTKLNTIPNFSFTLNPLYVSPSEIYTASAGTIREILSAKTIDTYGFDPNNFENCIAFTPDNTLMAISVYGGSWLVDRTNPGIRVGLTGLGGWNRKIFFTKDGRSVYALGQEGQVFFWKMNYGWKTMP